MKASEENAPPAELEALAPAVCVCVFAHVNTDEELSNRDSVTLFHQL